MDHDSLILLAGWVRGIIHTFLLLHFFLGHSFMVKIWGWVWLVTHMNILDSDFQASELLKPSTRPQQGFAAILKQECANFLKPVGGKLWKITIIGC